MHRTVQEMPEYERPYEKSLRYGVEILSDAELLAVIIRCGTGGANSVELSQQVIESCGGRDGIASLENRSIEELKRIRGIGSVKAVQLKALSEFSKRLWRYRRTDTKRFADPGSAAMYYMESLRRLTHEEVWIMFLDNSCALIREYLLSKGTVNASLVSAREVFIQAVKCDAVKLIMVHNHPSGDPTPSKEDKLITEKLIRAGMLMDIRLADSIIIGDGTFISLRERKLAEFF